jgi:hypothetical protein
MSMFMGSDGMCSISDENGLSYSPFVQLLDVADSLKIVL